ncbi:MAG TPA: penicillin-binding transpeptidase domain-containing protein [Solirubrobacteraceae bacterium]|jgi:hypothetical protein
MALRLRRPLTPRERRLLLRVGPVAVVAVIAFVVGVRAGGSGRRADSNAAERYAAAWARNDVGAMYDGLSASSRAGTSRAAFATALGADRSTATVVSARAGRPGTHHGGAVDVPVVVRTRAFGTLRLIWAVPVRDGRVHDTGAAHFPGLRPGEHLTRMMAMPRRATILARDGTPLARGTTRTPAPRAADVAEQVVGQLGTPPKAEREARRAEGYPTTALVGTTGLERALEDKLAGRPGGVLREGGRVIARSRPRRALPVRTSIDVGIERAAINGLAGRLGGVAAVNPRTGEILALAGVAYSALQPPGSTFKIITTAAALKAHMVKLTDTFPVQTGAVLEGRTLQNASGESCGGTLVNSFAQSCNSVFAPLGAKVGGRRLVAAAEAFGFNHPVGIPGAATSTIPSAATIGDDLAVGSSAIGQGRVQASALQMSLVAATVATGGRRPVPTLLARSRPRLVRAIPRGVARTLRTLMLAVVREGTGTAAQISGVEVAGKTGTAELQSTQPSPGQPLGASTVDTDAWFVACAPAARPRIATGVLLVQAGGGGAVAAPAARQVLEVGLKRR